MSLSLIAKIGINHNDQLDISKKLVDASVDSGSGPVKFQNGFFHESQGCFS